jgi:hypothetical protein
MAYVTGPAPKTVGRSVRLLGGGTGVRAAYLTYRERAARAIAEQIVLRAPELLEPPCEVRDEDGEIDEACEGQPLRHAEAYFTWLSDERARTQAERIQAALAEPDPTAGIEALNRLLAEDPEPVGAARIATFFAQQAHRERDRGEPAHAGQLYRKAAMLIRSADPARADRLHRDALLAEADVPGVSGPGRAMLHQAAAELGATVPAPPATQDVAPRAEIEADAGEVGGRIALATVLLFGLGLGFSPLRRRLLE